MLAVSAATLALAVCGCETIEKRKANEACVGDKDCASNICHRAVCGAEHRRGLTSPCAGHGECKSYFCSLGMCLRGNGATGSACLSDDECSSVNCQQGACSPGVGKPGGGRCEVSDECSSKVCHQRVCLAESPGEQSACCTGGWGCKSLVCRAGRCAPGAMKAGAACIYHQQCATAYCKLGNCAASPCPVKPDAGAVDAGIVDLAPSDQSALDLTPDAAVPDAPLPDAPVPDLATPDLSSPDMNPLKATGKGCAKGTECQSGVCQPVSLSFKATRSSTSTFNVALSALPGVKTQGVLISNATGPVPVWSPAYFPGAYASMGSPNAGAAPYVMSSTAQGGLSSLASPGATGLRFDMAGLSLVKSPTVDLRTKGKIKLTDPLLKATNNLIYFHSDLTAKNASGHRSEKRTYKTGTFRFLSAAGKVLAKGTFEYVNIISDYDSFVHQGWGQLTVSPGSTLYTELVAAFGKATLSMKVGSLQAPVWEDSPTGTSLAQMYAVYNATMVLSGLMAGICK